MGTERKARKSAMETLGCAVLGALGILLGLFLLLVLLAFGLQTGATQVGFELICGFWFFLKSNIPRISPNAATWLPGVLALVLAALAIHFFLRPWALKRGRRWTWGSSLASTALIPVLFVIAFLVPGILLQIQGLSGVRWFFREQGKGNSTARDLVRSYQMAVIDYSNDHDDKFPDSLAELPEGMGMQYYRYADDRGRHYWDRDLPREPVIYLGAGLTIESDISFGLLISPPFSGPEGRARYVTTIGGETILIPADEVDVWIQRSLAARRKAVEK